MKKLEGERVVILGGGDWGVEWGLMVEGIGEKVRVVEGR
ncbi:NAD-binding protein, partial [Siminovitchia fortis]